MTKFKYASILLPISIVISNAVHAELEYGPNITAMMGFGTSTRLSDSEGDGITTKWGLAYDLNQNLGLYGSFDTFDVISHSLSLATLGIKLKTEVYSDLYLVGNAGITNLLEQETDSHLANTVGLQVEYQINQSISALAGVDFYHHVPIARNESVDIGQFYAGIAYRFGQTNTDVVTEPEIRQKIEVAPVVSKQPEVTTLTKLFAFDSIALSSTISLESIVRSLLETPSLTVEVNGYTDSIGSTTYNEKLSERRAQTVAKYLIDNGIDESRISVFGLGEADPVISNDTDIGRANNRRVDIILK